MRRERLSLQQQQYLSSYADRPGATDGDAISLAIDSRPLQGNPDHPRAFVASTPSLLTSSSAQAAPSRGRSSSVSSLSASPASTRYRRSSTSAAAVVATASSTASASSLRSSLTGVCKEGGSSGGAAAVRRGNGTAYRCSGVGAALSHAEPTAKPMAQRAGRATQQQQQQQRQLAQVVNYNDLLTKQSHQQQSLSDPEVTPSANVRRSNETLCLQQQQQQRATPPSSATSSVMFTHSGHTHRAGIPTSGGVSLGSQLMASSPTLPLVGGGGGGGAVSSSAAAGFMEGPLPSEVREIIHRGCTGEAADEAERHARRLLSTSRRVKVYRAELQAAAEEAADVEGEVQKHQLVCNVLSDEITDIDRRIDALMRERALCETQLQQQQNTVSRHQGKLAEARERVAVLKNTVDNISQEVQMGYVVLRRLVPNLNIENYS